MTEVTFNEIEDSSEYRTEKINVIIDDKKEKEKESNVDIDFLNDDFSSKLFEDRKKENNPSVAFENDTVKNESKTYQSEEKLKDERETLGYDDYSDISEFLIDMIDMGVSQMCGAISKEKDTSQFEIRRDKKVRLRNQMNKILEKHQFKVSIEFLFIMSLGLSFRQPITDAIKIKNTKIKEEKSKILRQKEKERKRNISSSNQNEEIKNNEIQEVEVEEVEVEEAKPSTSSIRSTPFKKANRRMRRV